MKANFLTRERLKRVLSYDKFTGEFIWKRTLNGTSIKGNRAGTNAANRSVVICIDNVMYQGHYLACFYVLGSWPKRKIKHINGIISDNSWSNLLLPKEIEETKEALRVVRARPHIYDLQSRTCSVCGPVEPKSNTCPNKYRTRRGHGLTPEEARAFKKGKKCEICESTLNLVVDHCHKSLKIRGVLCSHCNAALGLFKEDIERIEKAIVYLRLN